MNKNGKGAFFEVDLTYPERLHDLHNDFTLVQTENVKVGKVTKLISNLNDKENYRLHYRTPLYYLRKGMVLTKVHKVLRFNESNWLAPYIELNSKLRAQATNDFDKENFKIMNNAY